MTPPERGKNRSEAVTPMILLDAPEDGCCDSRGWVEASATEDQARDMLAEFCADPDGGDPPWRPDIAPATRVWLRLDNPQAHYEDQRWFPCDPEADGASEFWEIAVA